jgi:import inner membrane translocase subunit TIM50
MTYLEQKRAQAQKLYLEEQEYWAKNADEIKRLMEEDRQKQMAEMKGSLMGMMPFSGGAGGAQPEQKA